MPMIDISFPFGPLQKIVGRNHLNWKIHTSDINKMIDLQPGDWSNIFIALTGSAYGPDIVRSILSGLNIPK